MIGWIAATVAGLAVVTMVATAVWPRRTLHTATRQWDQQQLYRAAFQAAVERDIDALGECRTLADIKTIIEMSDPQ